MRVTNTIRKSKQIKNNKEKNMITSKEEMSEGTRKAGKGKKEQSQKKTGGIGGSRGVRP